MLMIVRMEYDLCCVVLQTIMPILRHNRRILLSSWWARNNTLPTTLSSGRVRYTHKQKQKITSALSEAFPLACCMPSYCCPHNRIVSFLFSALFPAPPISAYEMNEFKDIEWVSKRLCFVLSLKEFQVFESSIPTLFDNSEYMSVSKWDNVSWNKRNGSRLKARAHCRWHMARVIFMHRQNRIERHTFHSFKDQMQHLRLSKPCQWLQSKCA